jgi:hypothetical protein
MAMARVQGLGEHSGVTPRSMRTLPAFGRRRGMLDAAVRRRWTLDVDDVPRAAPVADAPPPGSSGTATSRRDVGPDHAPEPAG